MGLVLSVFSHSSSKVLPTMGVLTGCMVVNTRAAAGAAPRWTLRVSMGMVMVSGESVLTLVNNTTAWDSCKMTSVSLQSPFLPVHLFNRLIDFEQTQHNLPILFQLKQDYIFGLNILQIFVIYLILNKRSIN